MFLARERPILNYGNEAWTIRKHQESRLTSGEMKFLRKTAGLSILDYKSNELHLIKDEITIPLTAECTQQQRTKWLQRVNAMLGSSVPTQMSYYVHKRRR